MKVYYLLNENKEVVQDDFERFDANCIEVEREDYHIVNGYNGAVFLAEYTQTEEYKQKCAAFEKEVAANTLRSRREQDCFSVINRGVLWYSRLTDEQKAELELWYQAWLDVTETGVIPNNPEWLK